MLKVVTLAMAVIMVVVAVEIVESEYIGMGFAGEVDWAADIIILVMWRWVRAVERSGRQTTEEKA